MKFNANAPPREFQCGLDGWVTLHDLGQVSLNENEVAAFTANGSVRYRLRRHSWGYQVMDRLWYANNENDWTPLIAGENYDKAHLLFVAPGAMDDFLSYCQIDGIEIFEDFSSTAKSYDAVPDTLPSETAQLHYIELAPDEQISVVTESGTELDVTRKSWGFYGSSSFRWRLGRFGLRPAFIKDADNHVFLAIVERGFEEKFLLELDERGATCCGWYDDPDFSFSELAAT